MLSSLFETLSEMLPVVHADEDKQVDKKDDSGEQEEEKEEGGDEGEAEEEEEEEEEEPEDVSMLMVWSGSELVDLHAFGRAQCPLFLSKSVTGPTRAASLQARSHLR